MNTRLRMTAGWPGVQVDPGYVSVGPGEAAGIWRDHWICTEPSAERFRYLRTVEPEFAIRELLAVDPTSVAEVLRFYRQWEIPPIKAHPPLRDPEDGSWWFGRVRMGIPEPGPTEWLEMRQTKRPEGSEIVAIAVVAEQIALAQTCAKHFLARRRGQSVAEVWQLWTHASSESVLEYFRWAMNDGLSTYRVHLELSYDDPKQPGFWEVQPEILNACYLQIYNMLLETEFPLRACQHCGGAFMRQRGRAAHGQHRSEGVLYCSKHCMSAAASKAYRARKRAERAKGFS